MASVINDSVQIFSLVSVDDWVAASNLSLQMKSIQLRLNFMPHKFKLMLDIFGHMIRINQNPDRTQTRNHPERQKNMHPLYDRHMYK